MFAREFFCLSQKSLKHSLKTSMNLINVYNIYLWHSCRWKNVQLYAYCAIFSVTSKKGFWHEGLDFCIYFFIKKDIETSRRNCDSVKCEIPVIWWKWGPPLCSLKEALTASKRTRGAFRDTCLTRIAPSTCSLLKKNADNSSLAPLKDHSVISLSVPYSFCRCFLKFGGWAPI